MKKGFVADHKPLHIVNTFLRVRRALESCGNMNMSTAITQRWRRDQLVTPK